jgi:hypothetical protein
MKNHRNVALLLAALVLAVVPAAALAAGPGKGHKPADPGSQRSAHATPTPGPKASLPAKAKAYGVYCRAESKKHVAGQHGTPFSQCVTAMAKLAKGDTKSPRAACKDESKKHVAGEHGTAFSRCVSAGAKLLHDETSSDS